MVFKKELNNAYLHFTLSGTFSKTLIWKICNKYVISLIRTDLKGKRLRIFAKK